MKIVVSENGYFLDALPDDWLDVIPDGDPYDDDDKLIRTCPKLIELVEQHGDEVPKLHVVEIPDEATDWRICITSYLASYDEMVNEDYVVYVVAGKIESRYAS